MNKVQPNSSISHKKKSISKVVNISILRRPMIDTTNYYFYTEIRKEKIE